MTGNEPDHPPTPPDVRFSASGAVRTVERAVCKLPVPAKCQAPRELQVIFSIRPRKPQPRSARSRRRQKHFRIWRRIQPSSRNTGSRTSANRFESSASAPESDLPVARWSSGRSLARPSPAGRPHPASLPVRVPMVESLLHASFLRFATVALIGPDWLLLPTAHAGHTKAAGKDRLPHDATY